MFPLFLAGRDTGSSCFRKYAKSYILFSLFGLQVFMNDPYPELATPYLTSKIYMQIMPEGGERERDREREIDREREREREKEGERERWKQIEIKRQT